MKSMFLLAYTECKQEITVNQSLDF